MSYEDGLIHRCDVERDQGGAQGVRGAAKPTYQVEASDVPCRITTPRLSQVMAFAQRDARLTHKIMLPVGTRLTNKHRLRVVDADTDRARVFVVLAADNPHEMDRLYVALCEEQEG